MYAIVADSGRQFRVETGDVLEIDWRPLESGQTVTFDRILAISNDDGLRLGMPVLDGASVSATVIGPTQGEKVYVQKFRRRKNSRRRTGHRQKYLKIKIGEIVGP
jgi:large subunit ribosomal protein L21